MGPLIVSNVERLRAGFVLSLLMTVVCAAWARQSSRVYGSVQTRVAGTPVVQANVVVKNARLGATTDSSGRFEIAGIPPGLYVIEFRHIAYKPQFRIMDFKGDEQIGLLVELEEKAIVLPDVIVTDTTGLDRLIHRYPGSIFITANMLLDTKADNVTDALKILAPRFEARTTNQRERRSRGRTAEIPLIVRTILLVIDGQRIYPSGEDFHGNPYWLDTYVAIKEIEAMVIHRGDNAWIRAGRRGERLDWLIEINRKKPR